MFLKPKIIFVWSPHLIFSFILPKTFPEAKSTPLCYLHILHSYPTATTGCRSIRTLVSNIYLLSKKKHNPKHQQKHPKPTLSVTILYISSWMLTPYWILLQNYQIGIKAFQRFMQTPPFSSICSFIFHHLFLMNMIILDYALQSPKYSLHHYLILCEYLDFGCY